MEKTLLLLGVLCCIQGSPEAPDGKSARRDCCKNADILNIVLNAKKRSLMQDPEVQAFWTEITNCIKGWKLNWS